FRAFPDGILVSRPRAAQLVSRAVRRSAPRRSLANGSSGSRVCTPSFGLGRRMGSPIAVRSLPHSCMTNLLDAFDRAARARINENIRAAEAKVGVEILPVVAMASGDYDR